MEADIERFQLVIRSLSLLIFPFGLIGTILIFFGIYRNISGKSTSKRLQNIGTACLVVGMSSLSALGLTLLYENISGHCFGFSCPPPAYTIDSFRVVLFDAGTALFFGFVVAAFYYSSAVLLTRFLGKKVMELTHRKTIDQVFHVLVVYPLVFIASIFVLYFTTVFVLSLFF